MTVLTKTLQSGRACITEENVTCDQFSFALAFAIAILAAVSSQVAINAPVEAEAGVLSGVPGREPSITAYKGVPYAAPPVSIGHRHGTRGPLPCHVSFAKP
jgi:hypothetical protein